MALCAIAVLVALVVVVGTRRHPPAERRARTPAAVTEVAATPPKPIERTPAPETTAAPEATPAASPSPVPIPLKLIAKIECAADCSAEHLAARVGFGSISAGDRETYEQLRHVTGADGPVSPVGLARPAKWTDVTLQSTGREARIGPMDVPRDDVYFLMAWSNDGRRYGWKAIALPDPIPANGVIDAGTVTMNSTTGVELHFVNVPKGVQEVLLTEANLTMSPDVLFADPLGLSMLQKTSRPEVTDLLSNDGTMLLETSRAHEISPLPPASAISFRVGALAGAKSERIDVPLKPGELTKADLDLTQLLGADSGRFLELDGRLVRADNNQPLAGITIERRKAPVRDTRVTDSDGRFTFTALPVEGESLFAVNMVEPTNGERTLASSDMFSLRPSPAEQAAGKATVEWRLTVFHWLVLDVLKDLRTSSEAFTLQRQNAGSKAWSRTSSSELVKEGERIAVPIREPGIYRVLMSRSLLEVIPSEVATFTDTTEEIVVHLDQSNEVPSRAVRVAVRDPAGKPVEGVLVRVMVPGGEPLPTESHTDAEGASLPEISNLNVLFVEVESDSGTLFSGEVPVGPDGRAEVSVPTTAPAPNTEN